MNTYKNKVTTAFYLWLAVVGFAQLERAAAATDDIVPPQPAEIIGVLRTHFVDSEKLDQNLLNEATISGILQVLGQGAQLLTAEQAASNAVESAARTTSLPAPLPRAEIIEPDIGYVRIADIAAGTAVTLDAELTKFAAAKVTGYVLDLRFADGTDYTAAAAVASRFTAPNVELFTLKQSGATAKIFRATDTTGAPAAGLADAPLMVLVNAQTRGAAEAVAGALRGQERGILIGGNTAGAAAAWQDIKLKDGRVLRVATAKVTLPKGTELFPTGIMPDVPVKADLIVEQEAVINAATNVTLGAALQPREQKKGLTEADLVKAFRGEAIGTNRPAASGESESEILPVRDVVLQRAVDILKGIRVLLSWQ